MKRIVGIIFEANPFHLGHQYLINQVIEDLHPDCIVAITSGYFSMRGEISLLSKKNKVQIMLDHGIDLVIELPIHQTLNSANVFSSSAIHYLNECGITDLCLGSESTDFSLYQKILSLEKTDAFKEALQTNLHLQYSYKVSYNMAVLETLPESAELLNHANATLALEYLRTLEAYPNITPHLYQRIGNNEENKELMGCASGTAIRESYLKGIDVSSFLPYKASLLSKMDTFDLNMHTLCLALFQKKYYQDKPINLLKEGIEHYLENNYEFNLTYEDNIKRLANKKYSKSRLRRTILSLMLEITTPITQDYLRILGFSETGLSYLRQLKLKDAIINIDQENKLIILDELKSVQLYSILLNNDYTIEEYQFPLKRKVK